MDGEEPQRCHISAGAIAEVPPQNRGRERSGMRPNSRHAPVGTPPVRSLPAVVSIGCTAVLQREQGGEEQRPPCSGQESTGDGLLRCHAWYRQAISPRTQLLGAGPSVPFNGDVCEIAPFIRRRPRERPHANRSAVVFNGRPDTGFRRMIPAKRIPERGDACQRGKAVDSG